MEVKLHYPRLFCSLQYDVSNLSITLHYITLRCSHLPLAHYCSFAPRHVLTAPGPCFLVHSAGTSLAFTLHHMTSYYIVIALHSKKCYNLPMQWTWSTQQGQDPGHRVSFNICRVRFFEARKNMSLSLYLPELVL